MFRASLPRALRSALVLPVVCALSAGCEGDLTDGLDDLDAASDETEPAASGGGGMQATDAGGTTSNSDGMPTAAEGMPATSEGTTTSAEDSCASELNDWQRMMLEAHNRWRASVEPPAANMLRVHWDTAIADNAAAWVASCDPDWPHSPEEARSNVGGYDVLGENLSYCAGTGCTPLDAVSDGSGEGDGEGWWEERHDYDWQTQQSTGVVSHYLALASSNTYAIGCATQRCDAPGPFGWDGEWWWTICQYGPRGQGYWVGERPYEAGEGGLVEPPEDVFSAHPGLCRGAD